MQSRALENSAGSETGLTVLLGPPGTGKTYCMTRTAEGHIRAGFALHKRRRVICTAPTNVAIETFLRHFVDGLNEADKPIEIVLFKGVLLRATQKSTNARARPQVCETGTGISKSSADPLIEEEDMELDDALWELVNEETGLRKQEANEHCGFYHQRRNFIQRCMASRETSRPHGMANQCHKFSRSLKSLRDPNVSKDQKQRIRADIQLLED